MTICKDEIFGPVQSILKWDTLEEVGTPPLLFMVSQKHISCCVVIIANCSVDVDGLACYVKLFAD